MYNKNITYIKIMAKHINKRVLCKIAHTEIIKLIAYTAGCINFQYLSVTNNYQLFVSKQRNTSFLIKRK